MLDLIDKVGELDPGGDGAARAHLLAIRCVLVETATGRPVLDRRQDVIMQRLLRAMSSAFDDDDHIAQLNDSTFLLVLRSRSISAATLAMEEMLGEIRSYFLGKNDDTVQPRVGVEALEVRPAGTLQSRPIAAFGGTGGNVARRQPTPSPEPSVVGDPMALGALQFAFAPVRDVRNLVTTTYYLRTHGDKPGHGICSDYEVLHGGEQSADVPSLDSQVLRRVEQELARYKGQKIPFLLVWQVHARTIGDPERFQVYARTLASFPPESRERIAVQVAGIEADWPVSRVQHVIGLVKPHTRMVAIRYGLQDSNLDMLAGCGATGISVPLNRIKSEVGLEHELGKLREAAARLGLVTVAERVPTRSAAIMAIAAGFQHVHADYLHDEQFTPLPAAPFDLAELFVAD